MVLTKSELISSLKNEVRILLHLAGKIDRSMLDYRPTPKQRSTIELLKYLTIMGPTFVRYARTGAFDTDAWKTAMQAAEARDLDQTLAAIAAHADEYETLLGEMTDDDFRTELVAFDGKTTSRGTFIVGHVLGGYAAYRMQLFLYLKACGREELSTTNLWGGVDAPAAAAAAV